MNIKPLLAAKAPDIHSLTYPLMASPKLDGIRCLVINGKAVTRTLKPIPNDYIRTWIEQNAPSGVDGEILLPMMTEPFSEVTSAVMSKSGEPDFVYAVFDVINSCETEMAFEDRFELLRRFVVKSQHARLTKVPRLHLVTHYTIDTPEDLETLNFEFCRAGYEGTMVRNPQGPYKFGKSTVKEGILLKIKAFEDEEATVLGVVEEMENRNEATVNALGHTERSTAKEGKVRKGRMGALRCRTEDGAEFNLGSGFSAELKEEIWARHEHPAVNDIVGRVVKFKHQAPPGGRKPGQAPRIPVFLGFRHEDDR